MIGFLRLIPLFASLNDEELEVINRLSSTVKYPKNMIVFSEEDEGNTLYIIIKGRVKIEKISDNGEEIILAVLKKGEFFGDMSLLDGKPRSATVISVEDSELLVIERTNFETVIETYPRIALKILRELTLRLRKADELIGNLAFLDVAGRIAGLLQKIGEERGLKTEEGIFIQSRPTHQDIANMVGASRETITRILKQLEDKEYIKMDGKDITILDRESIRSI